MTKKKPAPRYTVAGVLIRFKDDGTPLIGYHRSPKAGMNFTTVGGGVKSRETRRRAMERELLEEYQYPSLEALNIVELDLPDASHLSTSGIEKSYSWFLIIDYHRGDVTNPDPAEVSEIRWHPLDQFRTIIACFTEGKRTMLLSAINEIYKHHSILLVHRRAA